MSVVEEVRAIGIQQAQQRPLRALTLVLLSRVVLGLLAVSLAWAGWVASDAAADRTVDPPPLTVVDRAVIAPAGTSVSRFLDDLRERLGRNGASLVELELARSSGTTGSVRLTIDQPGTGAAPVDRLIASLERSALDDVAPRSVDPVPAGTRVTVDAEVILVAAPADGAVPDGRAAAVVLADSAERSGVELRGVGIPSRTHDPVRLAASGDLAAIVRLVGAIENEHSAPRRLRSVSLRRGGDGYEVALSFELRQDVTRGEAEVGR